MSASKSSPQVPWDKYPILRLTLYILCVHCTNWTGRQKWVVWQDIHKKFLADACGLPNGVEEFETMMSQWRESRKEKNKEKWEAIMKKPNVKDPKDDEEAMTRDMIYGSVKLIGMQKGYPLPAIRNGSDAESFEEDIDADRNETYKGEPLYIKESGAAIAWKAKTATGDAARERTIEGFGGAVFHRRDPATAAGGGGDDGEDGDDEAPMKGKKRAVKKGRKIKGG